jgi:S-adenosylmethionine-diacylgycerolhomoserine-N-methlytransferase
MAPSTSPASLPPAEADRFGLAALERFYRFQARLYDWTRPLFLFGRADAVRRLGAEPGQLVLDVGCGTGWSLPRLAATGARVVGIEPSSAMRERARRRIDRLGLGGRVGLDPRPYGSHAEHEGRADRILFSYSLSMIPPFEEVLERARRDLRPGGRLVVVDFLDAAGPVRSALTASHVRLGGERLHLLRRLFSCQVEVRSSGLWRYFICSASGARPHTTPEG